MSDIREQFNHIFEQADKVFQMKSISKLKNSLKSSNTCLTNIMDVLVRKSLLKEDLYHYEDTAKENTFRLIEEKSLSETDRPVLLYQRLKSLMDAIEFQSTMMPEDIHDFSEKFLENFRKILEYLPFHNYQYATGVNARNMKELTDKVVLGKDEMFRKVTIDNLKLLGENFKVIQHICEDLTRFLKENYKVNIRYEVLPALPQDLNVNLFNTNNQVYMRKLEEFMKLNFKEIPFSKTWIFEAVRDAYTVNEFEYLERLKNTFLDEADKKKVENRVVSPRERLIRIIIALSEGRTSLQDAYVGLNNNYNQATTKEKSFMSDLQDFFRKLMNIPDESNIIEIEYLDPKTRAIRKDNIDILEFFQAIKKKVALFTEMSKPTSDVYMKINRGNEESLHKFLEDTYFSMLLLKERATGLDAEIRIMTPKKLRSKMRDISKSLDNLNNLLVKIGEERRKLIMSAEGMKNPGR